MASAQQILVNCRDYDSSCHTNAVVPLVQHEAPVDILCSPHDYSNGRSSMPMICEKHAGHAEDMLL